VHGAPLALEEVGLDRAASAVLATSGPPLTHGFQAAFYALVGVALVGAAIAADTLMNVGRRAHMVY
jgi:hypothetical protein